MMTVREARKRLEYVKRLLKNWTYSPETEEAVDYAIQALGSDEVAYEQGYVDGWKERFGEPNILNGNGDYYDTHELIEVTAMCRHATDELVEWTGDEIVRDAVSLVIELVLIAIFVMMRFRCEKKYNDADCEDDEITAAVGIWVWTILAVAACIFAIIDIVEVTGWIASPKASMVQYVLSAVK